MKTCSRCGTAIPDGPGDRCPNCRPQDLTPPTLPTPASEWQYVATWLRRNRRATLVAAAIILLATAGGIGWLLVRDRTAQEQPTLRDSVRRIQEATNGTGRGPIPTPEVVTTVTAESPAPTQPGTAIPSRDPVAPASLLDLTPWYNAGFTQGWFPPFTPERLAGNALQDLAPGLQWLGETWFDVRGVIQLDGARMPRDSYPEQVTGIRIGRRCRRLHFLHAAAWIHVSGAEIGRYVLHADDGTTQTIPIRYGVELRDWHVRSDRIPTATAAEVVWTGDNSMSPLRLFKFSWDNPRPDVPIQTLDFVSAMTACAPFLLAVTTDGPDDDAGLMAATGSLSNPFLLLQRATAFERANRPEAALTNYSQAIELAAADTNRLAGLWKQAMLKRSHLFLGLGRWAEAGMDNCQARGIALRASGADSRLLDLSPCYTDGIGQTLFANWGVVPELPAESAGGRFLADAVLANTGVEFDVRGLFNLFGQAAVVNEGRDRASIPKSVTGIPVRQRLARIHVLQMASYQERDGTPIATCILHYPDGTTEDILIRYGEDVRGDPDYKDALRGVVAWKAPVVRSGRPHRERRVYQVTYGVARRDVEVESLDFVSAGTACSPVLIAVTLETPDDDDALMARTDLSSNLPLLLKRGGIFEHEQRFAEAVGDYTRAIELADGGGGTHPGLWKRALLSRSRVFQHLGRRREAGEDLCRAMGYPVRNPQARPQLLDLSLHYNAKLRGNWHGDIADNDLSEVPTDLSTLAGVEFDLRGLIQLDSGNPREPRFPVEATNIVVGLKCRRLHLLHSSVWGTATNLVPIGKYVLHFSEGQTREFPVVLGRDVRDWWKSRSERPLPEGMVVAWEGPNAKSQRTGQTVRLFLSTWDNPLPDVELKSIDFVSLRAMAAPFLVAVTLE
jgi:hypothetical protein